MVFDFSPYLKSVLGRVDVSVDGGYVLTSVELPLNVEVEDGGQEAGNDSGERKKRETVDVIAGLRKYAAGHVLLLGKPGAGKSTAFKRFLMDEARECLRDASRPIPVLLELRRLGAKDAFDGHDVTLLKLIMEWLELAGVVSEQQVRTLLRNRRLLLLLDGLNEMPTSIRLADFRAQFIDTPMIVSSRDVVTEIGIATKLHLLPLNDTQAKGLATNRLGSESVARQMLDGLPAHLHDFTECPLLLNMLCSVYQKSQSIPQNRGALFRQFTHDEYAKHKPSGTVTTRENTFFDFCDEVLQEVAFLMTHADGDGKNPWLQLPLVDAEKWLEKRFGERGEANVVSKSKQWLADALNFHLLQPAADHGEIEFIHQSFQEYYAAEWLLRYFDDLTDDQLCTHYLNPIKWTESLAVVAGILPDKKRIERFLKLSLGVDFVMASKLSGMVHDRFQEFSFEFVKRFLIEREIKTNDLHSALKVNTTRFSAKFFASFLESDEGSRLDHYYWFDYVDHLVGIDCEESKSYLIKILTRKASSKEINDREKVKRAMSGLAKLNDIKPLIDFILKRDDDDREVSSARNYIQEISDKKELPLLLNTLQRNNIPGRLKESIAVALGNINTEESSNSLIEMLADKNIDVRATACRMLEKSTNKRAIEPMLQYVYNDENRGVESAAIFLKSNVPEYARKCIEEKLKNSRRFTENIIFRFLFKVYDGRNPRAIQLEFLWGFCSKFENFIFEQARYINALMYMESIESVPLLMKVGNDKEWIVRSASVSALGYLGSENTILFIIEKLKDKHEIVRSNAVIALGLISHPLAVKAVFDELFYFKNEKAGVSIFWDIMYEMMRHDKYPEEFLVYSLNSEIRDVRKAVIKIVRDNPVAANDKPIIVRSLFKCAMDSDEEISFLAMTALGRVQSNMINDEIKDGIFKLKEKNKKISIHSIVNDNKSNEFDDCNDIEFLFSCAESEDGDGGYDGKLKALRRIEKIITLDFLSRFVKIIPDYEKFDSVFNVQKRHGHYSYRWFEQSSKLKFLPITKEVNMSNNTFNFNAPVTAGVIGDNHGTVNVGHDHALSAEDVSVLRGFLQAWSQHQQSQIAENPEESGSEAAQALEVENPGLMQRIQNAGISSLTSLIGDIATGEDPISAFIKAFIAGIGGAATRP